MMEFYDAVDTPNPMHGAAFPKKTNLPISIIPYWKPPHLVRVMVPVDDLLKNIGTDTWMYGFSKILPANVQEFVSTMPGAEELFYHQREHRSDPKLDKELFVTIWTSTNKAISPIHFDTSNIFHGVLQGRKSFIFVPPSDIMNLYTYPVYHPSYRNSMVCLTCPKPKGEVDHLLRKYPLLRNIKKFYVANLQPGEAVAFPSYWAHEVRSETDIVYTISSGRKINDLDLLAPTKKGAKLFDDIWELPHETQFLLLQSFFADVAYGVFNGLDNRLGRMCTALDTCLSRLYEQHVPVYVDSLLSMWKSGVVQGYGLLSHFHTFVFEQLQTRVSWYEVPFLMKACLT
eukprot:m.152341 g.152341  ORF g.152341 m.152341 type:complete len:343 (-) comp13300_c0_seq14:166-1194(-)